MAPMLFSRAILAGEPIRVFNGGDMERDFTYVDDIVDAVVRLLDKVPTGSVPSEVYNIGCGRPVSLMTFIRTLEASLGRKAELDMQPMQPATCRARGPIRPNCSKKSGSGPAFRWKRASGISHGGIFPITTHCQINNPFRDELHFRIRLYDYRSRL